MTDFATLAEQHEVHGAVLGVSSPAGTQLLAFGVPDDHRLQIASVTKPMIAAALIGADVDLRDPVSAHVPELAGPWASAATVGDLLRCRSGIGLRAATEWSFDDDSDDGAAEFCRSAAAVAPSFPTGEAWSYSNTSYVVAGRVLETVTGLPWDQALHEQLIAPLGLTATSGELGGASFASGGSEQQPWRERALGPGGGWLFSSVPDLLVMARHLLTIDALRAEPTPLGFPYFLDAWCTGVAQFAWHGETAYGWDGIGAGARAILRFVPERDTAIAFLCDTANGRDLWRDVAEDLLPELVGFGQDRIPVPQPVQDLNRYDGTYAWPDLSISVRAAGEGLEITGLGEPVVATPLDEANFVIGATARPDEVISFSRFEGGRPRMLHLKVWGFPLVGQPV